MKRGGRPIGHRLTEILTIIYFFPKFRTQTAERIGTLTGDVMEELSRLWFNIYEPEIVEKNITLLEQHVRTLFVDITSESVKRRDQLQDEVNREYTNNSHRPC